MAGDFREFFDVRKLDEQTLGSIEFVLTSPAYEQYFRPYMEGVLRQMNELWKDRSDKRKGQYPDEFLAGGVIFGEGLMKFFTSIINEVNMERVHAAMENMTPDMLYEVKRQRGLVRPVVGLDQPAVPERYDPNEDY